MNRILQLLCAAALVLAGCTKDAAENPLVPPPPGPAASIASCEGCHTDYAALKRLADPDTATGGGGCGGEVPHIEPYDRVIMGGAGYAAFKASTHGRRGCVTCHGGVDSTADKYLAHSGSFLRHPSARAEQTCGPCHSAIALHAGTSLHANGWGQKSMVTVRYGASSFEALPASLKEGYNANCAKCHGGCGDCHVNRPYGGGGGLLQGHSFFRRPDMRNNCVACHTSRVGHGYFGIGAGTVPDVHSTVGDGHCLNCHTAGELHGDGVMYNQRYQVPQLPTCTQCHSGIQSSNSYHSVHFTSLSCQTCHSQNYNNCGSCHVGGAGARVPAYLGYKIGVNPIPQSRPYRLGVLRRALSAPDSWQNYGVPLLANFAARPTYKYATPHNIQRWTSRTQVLSGRACYDNCHIISEGGAYRNRELYLFRSDLLPWEVDANAGVVVDGRLPAGWGTP